MDCWTGFFIWCCRYVYDMEIINTMNNKFFGLKKKKPTTIMILLFLLFYCPLYFFCCTLQAFSTVLSTTSSWFFACCYLNMPFIRIPVLKPKTLPAVCADLVNPWMARNIPACFWRCDVFWDLMERSVIPVTILKNKGWHGNFVNSIKCYNFLFLTKWQNIKLVQCNLTGVVLQN